MRTVRGCVMVGLYLDRRCWGIDREDAANVLVGPAFPGCQGVER